MAETFTDAYGRARKEKPEFVEGGDNAQGLTPRASLGYQAGNIANQVGSLASAIKTEQPASIGGSDQAPQQLPQTNPIAEQISAYADSVSPEKKSEMIETKKARMKDSFLRQPPTLGPRATGMEIGPSKPIIPPVQQVAPQVSPAPLVTSPIGPIKTEPIIGPNKPPDTGVTPEPGMIPSHVPFATTPVPSANQPLSVVPQKQVAPTAVGAEGGNISVNLSPSDRAIKGSLAAIDQQLASGVIPTAEQAGRIANIRRQAGFLRGGTDRVPVGLDGLPLRTDGGSASQGGGLSVTFDSSISPEQKAAFIADPVRPTAQIDRYNAQSLAAAGGMTQGQRASENASRILSSGASAEGIPPAIISGGPSKTWSQAKRSDSLALANAAARRDFRDNTESKRKATELGLTEQKLSSDAANNQDTRDLQRLGIVSSMRNQDATALREDRRNTLEDRKLTVAEAQQAARDKKEEQRFQTTDQRAADTNRLAQAKLIGGDEGGEAGLASTYNPRTPPPGPQASQVEQSAFGAWTRHNSANITADIDKGEKPQKIYDKYFSNVTPENQVALISMLPAEIRGSIAALARDRYTKK